MNKFEYLEVSGSYKDIGHAIGSRFGKIIQKVISERQKRIIDYERYLKSTEPYFKATKERFPNVDIVIPNLSAISVDQLLML